MGRTYGLGDRVTDRNRWMAQRRHGRVTAWMIVKGKRRYTVKWDGSQLSEDYWSADLYPEPSN